MRKTLLTLLTVALFAGAAALMARAQNAPSAPAALAVVNISNISKGLDLKKTMDSDMETLSKKLSDQRTAMENEFDNLRKELAQYKPESDPAKETAQKLLKKKADLEAFRGYAQDILLMEQRVRTMQMYRAINTAIAEYAQSHKILLVLVADDADLSNTTNQSELMSKVSVRKVMYADPSLDITSAIVEKMNTDAKTSPPK